MTTLEFMGRGSVVALEGSWTGIWSKELCLITIGFSDGRGGQSLKEDWSLRRSENTISRHSLLGLECSSFLKCVGYLA